MQRTRFRIPVLIALLVLLLTPGAANVAQAKEAPAGSLVQLEEIFARRALWLTERQPSGTLAADYQTSLNRARWALQHEQAKIRSLKQWAAGRGVRFVEAKPTLKVSYLSGTETRARFYVAQSLALSYQYLGEEQVNQFGVGTRHIIELVQQGDRWLIGMEWYSDPLDGEPDAPACAPGDDSIATEVTKPGRRGYNREGAVRYADQYCGLAAGCGNRNRYNSRFRDYSGEGGNCANFASQALRVGGGLPVPTIIRADRLVYHLTGSGRAGVVYRGRFSTKWLGQVKEGRFPNLVQKGDLVAYQAKGKMEHVAIVTGIDSRGYPLVNSHTLDRYHTPFDLGWDHTTTLWLLRMNG